METDVIVLAIISAGGATALVNGIFQLVKWFLERRAKKSDKAEEKSDTTDDLRADIADIKESLEKTQQTMDELSASMEDLRTADRYIMKDRIKYLANKYIEKRTVTTEELEDLIAMHRVYHETLRGNGFLDALMEKVKALPVVSGK